MRDVYNALRMHIESTHTAIDHGNTDRVLHRMTDAQCNVGISWSTICIMELFAMMMLQEVLFEFTRRQPYFCLCHFAINLLCCFSKNIHICFVPISIKSMVLVIFRDSSFVNRNLSTLSNYGGVV